VKELRVGTRGHKGWPDTVQSGPEWGNMHLKR
jgi:hypothetical protein